MTPNATAAEKELADSRAPAPPPGAGAPEEVLALARAGDRAAREAALRDLCRRGPSRRLPAALLPALTALFGNGEPAVAVLAAEACGWLEAPGEAVTALLATLEKTNHDELALALALAALQLCGLSAHRFLRSVGAARLRSARRAIEPCFRSGGDRAEACMLLAEWSAEGAPGAAEALEAAGHVEPSAVIAPLPGAAGAVEERLLAAWVRLGPAPRSKASVDWAAMLRLPSARARAVALQTLPPEAALRLLTLVTDMAFRDPAPDVRAGARKVVKQVVESAV